MVTPAQFEFAQGDSVDVLNPPVGFYALWVDAGGLLRLRDSAGVDSLISPGGADTTDTIFFGSRSIATGTAVRYLYPGYGDSNSSATAIDVHVPRSGTLKNLHVIQNNPAGNGNTISYTLFVNGVASALVASLASTAASASNLVDTVAVAAGDRIRIQVTKAASIGSSPADIAVSMEFAI